MCYNSQHDHGLVAEGRTTLGDRRGRGGCGCCSGVFEDDGVAAAVAKEMVQEPETQFEASTTLDSLVERSRVIMSSERHIELQSQLAQHLWVRKGSVSF